MTATPDRPATTPEGAGLTVDEARQLALWRHSESQAFALVEQIKADAYAAGLSEGTEGAGEVALSEEEWAVIQSKAPGDDDTNGWEWALLRRTIDAVLARRALPTAGRVVEVERVAEQVEALADKWAANGARLSGDLAHVGAMWRQRADDLRALAAAIRAGGSAES